MIIRESMKVQVYSIPLTGTIRQAVGELVTHHIGLLPVLDGEGKPVGVIGIKDLINLALPTTVSLLEDMDYIGSFGALEKYIPDEQVLSRPVSTIMRQATTVNVDSGLLRAYAIMLQNDLHDIPVVDQEGRLIGIASRVDIGAKILSGWQK